MTDATICRWCRTIKLMIPAAPPRVTLEPPPEIPSPPSDFDIAGRICPHCDYGLW